MKFSTPDQDNDTYSKTVLLNLEELGGISTVMTVTGMANTHTADQDITSLSGNLFREQNLYRKWK